MRFLLILLPLLLLPLFGCADSSTNANTQRDYDVNLVVRDNWGPVTVTIPLNVTASTGDTEQTTENASDLSPDVRFQLSEGASTGTMAGADAAIKDVTNTLRNTIKKAAIEKIKEQVEAQEPEEAVKPEEPVEETTEPDDIPPATKPLTHEIRFHHTQTSGPDKGKSLVLCPGQRMGFTVCTSDGIDIPRHSDGDGRETYWNMNREPVGDIVCVKDGKSYLYPATKVDDRGFVWGKCD